MVAQLNTLAALMASGSSASNKKGWNGMEIYAADTKTGKPLIEAGADIPHDAASLTKLMTFYVAMEAVQSGKLQLDQQITISSNLSGSHVRKGDILTVHEALGGMMTASDNAVADALSKAVSGNFVQEMNVKAHELGLDHTHFYNVHGLPEQTRKHPKLHNNTTTARDMAALITKINDKFHDEAVKYMGESSVAYGPKHRNYPAHYDLGNPDSEMELPEGYHAIAKTGLTNKAKYNIATVITPSQDDKQRQLTIVVLGMPRHPNATLARAAGVPDALLVNGRVPRGDHVRDALVKQLSGELLADSSTAVNIPEVAQNPPPLKIDPAVTNQALSVTSTVATPAHPPATEPVPPKANAHPLIHHAHPRHHPAHHKHGPIHHKSATHAEAAPFQLSQDQQAQLADVSAQFKDAVETGGTSYAPIGKNTTKLGLG